MACGVTKTNDPTCVEKKLIISHNNKKIEKKRKLILASQQATLLRDYIIYKNKNEI